MKSLKLANLIGELKGEPSLEGKFYTKIKNLLDEEQYTEVLKQYASESAVLLGVAEKDLESVYNLLIALTKDAPADILPTLVKNIVTPIVESSTEQTQLKLKVLGNLYNYLEASSLSRYDVYVAILNVAANGDEMDIILPTLPMLDTWIKQWGLGLNQTRQLFLLVSEKLGAAGSFERESYEYLLKYLSTYDNADAAALKTARPHALRAVKEAIRIPEVLNFEDVFKLQSIQSLKSEKLYQLLQIFLEDDLAKYRDFEKKNSALLSKEGLSSEGNVRKMRLLSLASLAANNVQGEVAYDTIAKALEISEDEVEMWVIDVIRAGLIDAKMNQLRKTVVVSRSTHRVFGEQQWTQLSEKITAWQSNLKDVLQVIANAKLLGGVENITLETNVGQ
ncbi:hypothetical protein HK102_001503 [Quaeritorhiza haematococci]|nr:hypothetical protein HK102_001503 [Quaeritorhiza haematococci]